MYERRGAGRGLGNTPIRPSQHIGDRDVRVNVMRMRECMCMCMCMYMCMYMYMHVSTDLMPRHRCSTRSRATSGKSGARCPDTARPAFSRWMLEDGAG